MSYFHLQAHERDLISLERAQGSTPATIAQLLGRHRCTITREIKRFGEVVYSALAAHKAAGVRARNSRMNALKLTKDVLLPLLRAVLKLMQEDKRSLGQALRILKKTSADLPIVSQESVYQWMYANDCQLAKALRAAMIRPRRMRRSRRGKGQDRRGKIANMTPIAQRSSEADERGELGHLEGDLIKGAHNRTSLITLVDRLSRRGWILPTASASTEDVKASILTWAQSQPENYYKSLTWDQGKELSSHEQLSFDTGVPVYFADAHSPWQRGSNENFNLNARRYFPKGTTMPQDPKVLERVTYLLNTRPMAVLFNETPLEVHEARLGVALRS